MTVFRALAAVLFAALLALPAAARAQDKLTILLDWFLNPDHAALVIAKTQGMFARHGLEVERPIDVVLGFAQRVGAGSQQPMWSERPAASDRAGVQMIQMGV